MRDMLRGYGFTPAHAAVTDPSEVYEEFGEACETLIVQGCGKVPYTVSLFSTKLAEVLCDSCRLQQTPFHSYNGLRCTLGARFLMDIWVSKGLPLTKRCPLLQGSLFQLREVKVLGAPGAHPLLELAGQATICYIVQDEANVGADNWHEAPRLSLETTDASQTSRAAPHVDSQVSTAA